VEHVAPSCPICHQLIYVKPNEDINRVVTRHIDAGCPKEQSSVVNTFVCGARGCHVSDLSEKIVCSNCHIAFCLKHRLPADHKCTKIPQTSGTSEKDTKQQPEPDFTSILKKKIEETIKKYSSATPTTRKQYVNNMKSTATGDQKVPADKRFYLEVLYPVAMNIQPKMFFFDQSKRFGQVLDHVAATGKIKNENNISGKPKLVLVALRTGKPIALGNKLEESKQFLTSGDAILLEYENNLQ